MSKEKKPETSVPPNQTNSPKTERPIPPKVVRKKYGKGGVLDI